MVNRHVCVFLIADMFMVYLTPSIIIENKKKS